MLGGLRRGCLLVLVAGLLAGLAGCSGPQVQVDEDHGLQASGLIHFGWRSPPLQANGNQRSQMIFRADPIIRNALNDTLGARGYRLASGTPELLVDYRILRLSEPAGDGPMSPRDYADAVWAGPGAIDDPSAFYNHPTLSTVETLTLLVTVFDATGRLLWQGRSSQLIDDLEPKDAELQRIIQRLCDELEHVLPVAGN